MAEAIHPDHPSQENPSLSEADPGPSEGERSESVFSLQLADLKPSDPFRWLQLENGQNGFQPIWDYPKDAVIPVAGTGSACIVIHRSVFERVQANEGGKPSWYNRLTNPTTAQLIGEDLSFCYRVASLGIPMFVDTGTKTTHLKPIWLQEDDYIVPVFDDVMEAG
jgi:hypothetical protein